MWYHNRFANSANSHYSVLTVLLGRGKMCTTANFLCLGSSDGLSYNIEMDWCGSSLIRGIKSQRILIPKGFSFLLLSKVLSAAKEMTIITGTLAMCLKYERNEKKNQSKKRNQKCYGWVIYLFQSQFHTQKPKTSKQQSTWVVYLAWYAAVDEHSTTAS